MVMAAMARAIPVTSEEKCKLFGRPLVISSQGLHSVAQPLEIATGDFPAEGMEGVDSLYLNKFGHFPKRAEALVAV